MADFQQILGANEQIFQIFGKQNADFWAKKYGNTGFASKSKQSQKSCQKSKWPAKKTAKNWQKP